ncbi:exo 1,3/1,4-beta-D-glucan glucohydrolase [Streptosporangium sp. NBC_01756]|uniref:exo 1,3/1,4-beta-D-glucan glucohydrolase n=1 Tax=Streptosporangium sp. NBC_01756 TaxID=2975950 RepID=UPI002DD8CB1E|nr:exo 1,3/1,4-beta-D-glucan glucohydrolase [Streptosporangium sp. NBC_01756]WSC87590.1 exo 1,3/1,4-beta-D-glucan glucohydrolase [Streptosporangium sp. NBC_01756]
MTRPLARSGARRSGLAVLAGLALLAAGAPGIPAVAADAAAGARQPEIGGPSLGAGGCARIEKSLPVLADWPKVKSRIKRNPADEKRVAKILAGMTLAEKIGQMTQPEIAAITPEEVRQYGIGSVLNGGGSWPGRDKHASPQAWLDLADAYWQASLGTRAKIPVIWGIDAVHGNNNVYGATVFPHNIGLGAAHDPCLVRDIGAATAAQIRATGQDWAFAPTLAVVRDDRWGRTYEGFSEDPRITRAYGYEAVNGLQGGHPRGIGDRGVIATAKHFIGDGGTLKGIDQGVNPSSEAEMVNMHGQGYYGALAAGAQTVMVSFNSWTNTDLGIDEGKLHGSRRAVTDILKQKMDFDGVVVSDWNGIGQVAGCTNASCARAVNAGVDVVMVPNDWKAFIANTIGQVEAGEIPMARVDDAVTRILRVKLRAGVFDAPKPSGRALAGSAHALEARKLAREAVRRSQVLLKNNGGVLPLARSSKVLVVGKSADSLQNQTGGWTLTWQGTGNTNADFPNGTTILGGLRAALGEADVTFSETADGVDPSAYDAVVAVIGETPYAEGVGDLGRRSLEAAKLYPGDLAVLDKVSGRGAPVVTVYVSGRPLWVNKELNRSDAFVAAWLPGTEGGGVADLLVRGSHQEAGYTGTLSYSWPKSACQTPLNLGDEDYEPLFPLGYGLRSGQSGSVGTLDETGPEFGCGQPGGGGEASEDLEIFNRADVAPYRSFIGSADNWGGTEIGVDGEAAHSAIGVVQSDVNVQQDGLKATWNGGGPAQFYLQDPAGGSDLRGYLNADAALVFDTIVHQAPAARTVISVHCGYPCFSEVVATSLFQGLPAGSKATVKIPIACFAATGLDLEAVNTPFLVYTEGAFSASFANVRWVPKAAEDADARSCDSLT